MRSPETTSFVVVFAVDRMQPRNVYGRNMPVVGIMEIEYNATTGYLVAATHGRSVWRMAVGGNSR